MKLSQLTAIAAVSLLAFLSACSSDDGGGTSPCSDGATSAPVASLKSQTLYGNQRTVFQFDASGSEDPDCSTRSLKFRWDTDGDGTYDTPAGGNWTSNPRLELSFSEFGLHTVRVQVSSSENPSTKLESTTALAVEVEDVDYPSIYTWIGTGFNGSSPEGASLRSTELATPSDITISADGTRAYISDWNNHRVLEVRDGRTYSVCGTGTLGDAPEGTATAAGLNHPTNISIDPQGRLVLAAWHNSMIMRIDPSNDSLVRLAGRRPIGGLGTNRCFDASDEGNAAIASCLDLPSATAFDSDGNLYISDQKNTRIVRVNPVGGEITDHNATGEQSVFETIVGVACDDPFSLVQPCPDGGFNGNGIPAVEAYLRAPGGQSADPTARITIHDDVLYIADSENHMIRSVDLKIANPTIELVAGTEPAGSFPTPGFDGDGGQATSALLRGPRDVAVDSEGNVFIADSENHRIRRVDAQTGIITTIVGNGIATPQCIFTGDCDVNEDEAFGDGGPAVDANLAFPYGIALDGDDNLYIVDSFHQRVRVVMK